MLHITAEQIETFLTLARTCSYRETSELLYITQPTVTKQIQKLEKELELPLFRRTTQNVTLTEAGTYFAETWAPLFHRFNESLDEAKHVASKNRNELVLGLVRDNPKSLLAQQLTKTFASYCQKQGIPELLLRFQFYSIAEQREALRHHQVDFIFSYGFDYDSLQNIDSRKLARRAIYAMLPPEHPLFSRDSISLQELKDETFFIISARESVSAHNVTLAALKRRLPQAKTKVVPNFQTLSFALNERLGIALGNQHLIGLENFREVPIREFDNEGYDEILAWRTDDMSVNKIVFLNYIRDCIKDVAQYDL